MHFSTFDHVWSFGRIGETIGAEKSSKGAIEIPSCYVGECRLSGCVLLGVLFPSAYPHTDNYFSRADVDFSPANLPDCVS